METIQIQISEELAERLYPYQNNLIKLLELGLQYMEGYTPGASDTEQTKLLAVLHKAGIIGPDYETIVTYISDPTIQSRQPIQVDGRPASEIIIEQRRGLLNDD